LNRDCRIWYQRISEADENPLPGRGKRRRGDETHPRVKRARLSYEDDLSDNSDDEDHVHYFRRVQIIHKRPRKPQGPPPITYRFAHYDPVPIRSTYSLSTPLSSQPISHAPPPPSPYGPGYNHPHSYQSGYVPPPGSFHAPPPPPPNMSPYPPLKVHQDGGQPVLPPNRASPPRSLPPVAFVGQAAPAPAYTPRFVCDAEGCGGRTFARSADFRRHYAVQHAVYHTKFWCSVIGCQRSIIGGGRAFHRRDKLMAHIRSHHSVQ
jgi:hypothetical protein